MYVQVLVTLCLVGSSFQHTPTDKDECHPAPSETATPYIVGYGSLINSDSKNKTYPNTGINIPVRVLGFRRTWTARGFSNMTLSTTYLGVEKKPEDSLNGVIFSVPDADALGKYDDRERYYCRVKVPREHVFVLRGKLSDNGTFPSDSELKKAEFWIYVTIPKYSLYPNEQYPIVQSYVDIFLGGCVQMERKYGLTNYSEECVTHTTGWNSAWVNDRIHPRRPWTYQAEAGSVDRLLSRTLPDYPARTYIERIYFGRSEASLASVVTPLMLFTGTIAPLLVGKHCS